MNWHRSLRIIIPTLDGGFKWFLFHPCLRKWSNSTHIFQLGWNQRLRNPLNSLIQSSPLKCWIRYFFLVTSLNDPLILKVDQVTDFYKGGGTLRIFGGFLWNLETTEMKEDFHFDYSDSQLYVQGGGWLRAPTGKTHIFFQRQIPWGLLARQ